MNCASGRRSKWPARARYECPGTVPVPATTRPSRERAAQRNSNGPHLWEWVRRSLPPGPNCQARQRFVPISTKVELSWKANAIQWAESGSLAVACPSSADRSRIAKWQEVLSPTPSRTRWANHLPSGEKAPGPVTCLNGKLNRSPRACKKSCVTCPNEG